MKCERCNQLENELIILDTILDAIHRLLDGENVSDFELSFPEVRRVYNLMNEGEIKCQKN